MIPPRSFLCRAIGAGLLALGLVCAAPPGAAEAAPPAGARAQKQKPAQGQKKHRKAKGEKKPTQGGAAARPAAAARREPAPAIELAIPVHREVLDNGLRVVLSVERTSPTVAVAVTYDVGSRDEQEGRSGFAHLLERMMFQGSESVPRGDHRRLVAARGGVLDAATSPDRTSYVNVVPAGELALALWLEADRMRALDLRADHLESQRKAVQEQHHDAASSVDHAPSAVRLQQLVFQGYWPYERSTLGTLADIEGAQLDWVRDFFATHYGPESAVLTLVGDFDADEAMGLVRKYFDRVPRRAQRPFADAPFPEQTSQRTAVVTDAGARAPAVLYGWPAPPAGHADHAALELAAGILAGGEGSRLHQILVRDRAAALSVQARMDGRRGPSLFSIDARLTPGAKVGDVERLIEAEMKALSTRGPSDAELARAKRRAEAALVLGLQRRSSLAARLGEHELFFGDARHLNGVPQRLAAVSRDDIQRAAREHLGPTRRTIVETYPASVPEPTPIGAGTKADVETATRGAAKKPTAKKPPAKKPAAKKPAAKNPAVKKKPAPERSKKRL